MSLPCYPHYKNSGASWMGDVPANWETRRAKHVFEVKKHIAGEEGYDILSITQKGIKVKDIESNDGQLSMDYGKYQFVEIGDFAMNHMDLLTGYVDISPFFGVTSPDYRVFSVRDSKHCDAKYFLYLYQNGYRQKIFYAFGQGASQLGRWRFPTEQFNDFILPLPSLAEQTAIATFLDRETAKIDGLIAEQEKLIALLAEKRQATISHAVTKGLNPAAPMKDSGVAWLGEVPAHWSVHSLRHHLKALFNGITSDQIDEGKNTVPVTRIETISKGVIDTEKLGYISADDARDDRLLLRGDILFSNINSLNMIGNCAQYCDDTPIYAGMNLLVIRPVEYVNYSWLFLLIKSSLFRREIESRAKPAINQASIPQSAILSITIATPTFLEQVAIANFINKETTRLDALAAEATHGIALLKERRSALISAAVTGKIDVRHLAEAEAA